MSDSQQNNSEIFEAALTYLRHGFSIIPLHSVVEGKCTCGTPSCENSGKHPAIPSWREYQKKRPTEDDLKAWFDNGVQRNIGILTGAISGVCVVDIDTEEGIKFVEENNFPNSPMCKTGKNKGYHLYYRYKEGISNSVRRLPGIDIRGAGGYAVAPPSIHVSGRRYEWVKGRGLDDLPLADFPEFSLTGEQSKKTPLRELYSGVSEGSRNDTLAKLTGSWVNDGLTFNECLENAYLWNQKNDPPLFGKEVEQTVKSIFEKHHQEKKSRTTVHEDINQTVRQEGSSAEGYKSFDPATLPTGLTLQAMEVNVEWLIKGLLPRQAITVLHGRGGIGKTWLSLQMAESIEVKSPFLGLGTLQAPVYYIDFENPLPVLVERVKALNIQHVRFWHISNEMPPPPLDTLKNDDYGKLPEGSLIIFDTFRSAHTGDENDSKDISRVLTVLKRLREKGYTVLLLHHTSKGNDSRYKGSTAILDLCDHELNLCDAEKKEGEQDTYKKLFTPQKSRYQTEELILDFDLDEGGFFLIPDQTEETLKQVQKTLSELPEDERKKTTLVDHLKAKLNRSRNDIRRLLDRGMGKFWTTKSGDRNATFYTANSVCQFATPIYNRQTEKLNLPIPTPNGKLTLENNLQPRMDTEFASLPDPLRQTEKLDLREGEI